MKIYTYILFVIVLNSCCDSSVSDGTCTDDFGSIIINLKDKPLKSEPNDGYFLRKNTDGIDSIKVAYIKGATNYVFEYFFKVEPNYNFTTIAKNTYIYSVPSARIQDTLSNIVLFDRRNKTCGICSDFKSNVEIISYYKNGVSSFPEVYYYGYVVE